MATVFATAAFMVQLAMPSAFAATAPSDVGSIFPAHDGSSTDFANDSTGSTQMAVLSDKAGPAHLTAVTSPADTTITTATLVNWYYCDTSTLPGAAGALCTLIGTDTSATSAFETSGYTGGTIDDAWSITWDIPASLDNLTKFIVVEGCNGTADSTHSNCTDDAVPGVLLDDSSVGATPATSAGSITSPTNGSGVSDEATLKLTASTSPELTAVGFGFDSSVGSGDDDSGPMGSDDVDSTGGSSYSGAYNALSPDTTTATARTWSVSVTAAQTPNNDEQALTLWSSNGDMNFTGSGGAVPGGVVSAICAACASATGGLALDRNYVVLEPGVPGKASDIFLKRTADVTADPTCATGPTTISAPAGSVVSLTGCLFDAFGNPVTSEGVVWGLLGGGTGFFTTTPPTTTDANGQAVATVSAPASAAGTNTIINVCLDHNTNGICDSTIAPPAVDLQAAITISWSSQVATHHKRSVSLRLRDSLTATGRVTAGGFAACVSSVPVKVQRKVSGVWRTIRKVTTGSAGFYKAHVANRHGRYRAVAPRVTKTGGMDICNRAVSPTRTH